MIGYRIREELPDSALELEKAQAVIKYVVKRAVMEMTPWIIVDGIIRKTVQEYTDKLEDQELKAKAINSLLAFATVQYRKMQEELSPLNLLLFSAFLTLSDKESSEYAKSRAETIIQQRAPSLVQRVAATPEYIESAQPLRMFSQDYIKQVESAWRDLANSEAKDSYSDRVSLRNVAEMSERYKKKQEEITDLIESGKDLVWISTHANCSERCQPYQGRLYSMRGRTGEIDGVKFVPLSTATDVYVTTKSGKTYKNGCISGFNCRHTLTPYRKGNKPIEVSAKTIETYRKIEETQRAMEREIREKRALSIGLRGLNDAQAKALRKESNALFDKYAAFCKKNNVAYYPARCRVFDGEELISPKYKTILDSYKK